jgi:2-dehydro-3-deoxy-D-gluconate 5-dehydrogenase
MCLAIGRRAGVRPRAAKIAIFFNDVGGVAMRNGAFDLKGKVAIVTGGNGGIGLGIAKGLGAAGASIVVAARKPDKNERAVAELEGLGVRAVGLPVDVQDEASVQAMVKAAAHAFGRIDILVNNAGIAVGKAPQDVTLDEWNRVVNANLTGVFLCSKEVYPQLVRSGGGKIINIGSMFSIFGSEIVSSYAASKGGVVQLTKSLALAWAKDNVQVNAILPGWIRSEMTAAVQADPERSNPIVARIPASRWGEPDDLAGAAVFLASRASDYITGISLPVDGGFSSR